MKFRITILAIATCLASSFAFADNPSDAPLEPNDATITVVQPKTRARDGRYHVTKKEEASAKTKCEAVSQNDPKARPGNPAASTMAKN
jgi:hypothetical protein